MVPGRRMTADLGLCAGVLPQHGATSSSGGGSRRPDGGGGLFHALLLTVWSSTAQSEIFTASHPGCRIHHRG